MFVFFADTLILRMLQKGCYSVEIKYAKTFLKAFPRTEIYTLEIYTYGSLTSHAPPHKLKEGSGARHVASGV